MQQEKTLSIRLSPGGLSFWTTGFSAGVSRDGTRRRDLWSASTERTLEFDKDKNTDENITACAENIKDSAGGSFHSVEVYPDTLRTVLIPNEYSENNAINDILAINNIKISGAEESTCVRISDTASAVIVYDRAAIEAVKTQFSDISIESVFRLNNDNITKYGIGRKRATGIYLTPGNVYITVYEKKSGLWLYADAMKWSAPADILYYISILDKKFDLRKGKVYLRGNGNREVYTLLRKYFRKSRCE